MRDDQYKLMYHVNPELGKEYTMHALIPKVSPISRPGYEANVHVRICVLYINSTFVHSAQRTILSIMYNVMLLVFCPYLNQLKRACQNNCMQQFMWLCTSLSRKLITNGKKGDILKHLYYAHSFSAAWMLHQTLLFSNQQLKS